LKFNLDLPGRGSFTRVIFLAEWICRHVLILGGKASFNRAFKQLLYIGVQIMRRLPRFIPPEIGAGIRNLVQVFLALLLKNSKRIIACSRVNEYTVIALPEVDHIRPYAANGTDTGRLIPALVNRDQPGNP